MTKENGLIRILLLVVILCTVSCKETKFDIEQNHAVFFEQFALANQLQEKNITELSIYYYDQDYYYDVCYYVKGKDFLYCQLFVIHIDYFSYQITLNDIENDYELQKMYGNYYTSYVYAKEHGESKIYTKEEIDELEKQYIK